MQKRGESLMGYLREMERCIRASEFWRGKPDGLETAIMRLYLTGAGDCGGPVAEGEREAATAVRFEALWKLNPETAKVVDWCRLDHLS